MITFENKIAFEQQVEKCKLFTYNNFIYIGSNKNYYLSYIRSLATSGNFPDLIKFIHQTAPNVSL